MLCAHHIGLPQILIVILTIPAPVLGSQVIDVIELLLVENLLQLPVVPDITPDVVFPVGIVKVQGRYLMTPALKLIYQIGADKSCTASY